MANEGTTREQGKGADKSDVAEEPASEQRRN